MSVSLKTVVAELNDLLRPQQFQDYCPNGLQVEGKAQVSKLVAGVTASQALVDAAIAEGADLIIVHHGYFWRGEDPTITGMKKNRIQALLDHEISLLAYHLPLDAHPRLGNNAQLGKLLGFEIDGPAGDKDEAALVMLGKVAKEMAFADLAKLLADKLGREPLAVAGSDGPVNTVAWCTGAAQGFIEIAADAGADTYITGEVSEQTVHIARERGMHFFAAGHHATERYGVQAVGHYLAEKYGLDYQFIDIDNPA